jgi:hypothetical protein
MTKPKVKPTTTATEGFTFVGYGPGADGHFRAVAICEGEIVEEHRTGLAGSAGRPFALSRAKLMLDQTAGWKRPSARAKRPAHELDQVPT